MFWIGFLAAIGLMLAIYGISKGIETLIEDAVRDEVETISDRINYLESVAKIHSDKIDCIVVQGNFVCEKRIKNEF